jgi:hypothetical protein
MVAVLFFLFFSESCKSTDNQMIAIFYSAFILQLVIFILHLSCTVLFGENPF